MFRAVIVVVASGCELFAAIPNAQIGPDDDASNQGDAGGDGNEVFECETTAECSAPGVCVEHACRACDSDAHCGPIDQAVCLPDGTCADAGRIAYASPTGTGDCSAAAPCSFEAAFTAAAASPTIDIVKLQPGDYPRGVMQTVNDTVIVAGEGATLTATAAIQILRTEIGSLTVVGATFVGNAQFNLLCFDNGNAPALTVHRIVTRNGAYGIGGFNCPMTVTRSSIADNGNFGLYATVGPLRIANTYITGNGVAGNGGGAFLSGVLDGRVELSTFAGNQSTTAEESAAIDCNANPVIVTSSILFGNTGATTIDPVCTVDYSIVDPSYTAGANNLRVDPMFVGAGDYHLTAASPARGAADPALTAGVDREGEPRPQTGTTFDIGADEIP
ncbi:MAG: hypothetical protein ABI867_01480 [Kofleriaceae bacterium]